MKRGDLVTVALQGEYGKPRPALVVQSDRFADMASVAVLPITSTLIEAPLIRISVDPSQETGLRVPSQVMVDKPMTVSVKKVGPAFGHLDDAAMLAINRAMLLFLGMAD